MKVTDQTKDYYAGPKVHDEDFVITNYMDLHAIRESQQTVDMLDIVLSLIAIGALGTLVWRFFL